MAHVVMLGLDSFGMWVLNHWGSNQIYLGPHYFTVTLHFADTLQTGQHCTTLVIISMIYLGSKKVLQEPHILLFIKTLLNKLYKLKTVPIDVMQIMRL